MAANFCKRFLAAKSLINANRNLKNVQGNYGYKNNTTHQPSKTYGKYLWIIGGGATAIICINLFKSGTNSVKAFNMRHSKRWARAQTFHLKKNDKQTRRKFTKDFAAGCPPGLAPQIMHQAPQARFKKKKKRSRKKKRGAPLQLQSKDLRHKIERLKRRRNNNTPKKRRRSQKNIQINIQINM